MDLSFRAAGCVAGLLLISTGGCASHTIYARAFDGAGAAGQDFTRGQVSYLGDRGANSDSTGYPAQECRTGDLVKVSVKRNFGQTLITLLTLGMVTPATIHFQCEIEGAPDPVPGDPQEPF